MRIKQVIIQDFCFYKESISFEPFHPSQNCIVWLNESDKSNFYKTIGFVLLEKFYRLSSHEKTLINDSLSSYTVDVIFDNITRSIPVDSNEVYSKRVMNLFK
jgi:chromosome segregation ATPase